MRGHTLNCVFCFGRGVVVKWSAGLPSTMLIPVWIPSKSTILVGNLFEMNENKQNGVEDSPRRPTFYYNPSFPL